MCGAVLCCAVLHCTTFDMLNLGWGVGTHFHMQYVHVIKIRITRFFTRILTVFLFCRAEGLSCTVSHRTTLCVIEVLSTLHAPCTVLYFPCNVLHCISLCVSSLSMHCALPQCIVLLLHCVAHCTTFLCSLSRSVVTSQWRMCYVNLLKWQCSRPCNVT